MARDGVRGVGSMATTPPGRALQQAAPSNDYFKQLFAQVTNPPIDCIREEIITSAETRWSEALLHPGRPPAAASS